MCIRLYTTILIHSLVIYFERLTIKKIKKLLKLSLLFFFFNYFICIKAFS